MPPEAHWDAWWATTPHRRDLLALGWGEPPPHWTIWDLKQLPDALDTVQEPWVAHSPSGATTTTTHDVPVLSMPFWVWLDEQRE